MRYIKSDQKPYYKWESMTTRNDHTYMYNGKIAKDTTTRLCYTMLISPAFKDLSTRQRMLYVYAKTEFFGSRDRPRKKFKEFDSDIYFYLNHYLLSSIYELYPKTNKKGLYDDIKALISHGFIENVTNGRANQQRSIYKYSDKWKTWEK